MTSLANPVVLAPRWPLPPHDGQLPQLAALLDRRGMAEILARSLPAGTAIDHVDIARLEYKPGKCVLVHYEIDLGGESHSAVARASATGDLAGEPGRRGLRALICAARSRSAAAEPLRFDGEVEALVSWFPFDEGLPVLAADPEELATELRAAGVSVSPHQNARLLKYRPPKRAILRIGEVVLKAYGDGEERFVSLAAQAQEALDRLGTVWTAPLLATIPPLRLVAQGALPGTPGTPPDAVAWAPRAAAILRRLHSSDIEPPREKPAADQLERIQRVARRIGAVIPALSGDATRVANLLSAALPADLGMVPCHGDYSVGQLLLWRDRIALIDVDELCFAPPALDIASYTANLVAGRPGDEQNARRALHALLDAYGPRPEGLGWYLATAIMRRAMNPFQLYKPRWPENIERMIAAAEDALEW